MSVGSRIGRWSWALAWVAAFGFEAWALWHAASSPPLGGAWALLAHGAACLFVALGLRWIPVANLSGGPATIGAAIALLLPGAGVVIAAVLAYAVLRSGTLGDALERLERDLHGSPGPPRRPPSPLDPAQALHEALDVEPLIDALRYGEPARRRAAIEALRRHADRFAVRALREALAEPDDEVRALAAGALAAIEERLGQALQSAREACAREPKSAQANEALGRALLEYAYLGVLDEQSTRLYLEQAVAAFGHALEYGKEREPELLVAIGRALLRLGDLERALGFFHRALEENDRDGRLYLWRAEALVRLGRYEIAAHDCWKALERGVPERARAAARFWASLLDRIAAAHIEPEQTRGFRTPASGLHRAVLPRAELPEASQPGKDELEARIGALLRRIAGAEPRERAGALAELMRYRCPQAVGLVIERLDSLPPAAQALLCRYFGDVGGQEAARALSRLLESSHEAVREEAALAVERLEPTLRAETLRRVLSASANPSVRAEAARLLGATVGEAALRWLLEALSDQQAEVRLAAIEALRAIRDVRARGALAARLFDPDPKVRASAARAIGELDPHGAKRLLIRALRTDPASEVRRVVVWALGRVGTGGARRVLLAALREDPDDSVRLEAVRRLGRQRIGAVVLPLLRAHALDPSSEVRLLAGHALASLPSRIVKAPLGAALEAPQPALRLAAVLRLAERELPGIEARLVALVLRDDQAVVRAAAAQALARLPRGLTQRAERALVRVARSAEPLAAYAALLALASRQAAEGGLERLEELLAQNRWLAQKEPPLIAALLQVATRVASRRSFLAPRLFDVAHRALSSSSPEVVLAAANLFARTNPERALETLIRVAASARLAPVRAAAFKACSSGGDRLAAALLRCVGQSGGARPTERVALEALAALGIEPQARLRWVDRALVYMTANGSIEPAASLVRVLARRLGACAAAWIEHVTVLAPSTLKRMHAGALALALERGWLHVDERLRERTLGRLEALLEDSEEEVRAAAAQALGRLEAIESIARLVELSFEDRSASVREAARKALRSLVRARSVVAA